MRIERMFPDSVLEELKLSKKDRENYENYLIIPIELLQPNTWNYKVEVSSTSKKLNENLKRNGQIENIQVRELEDGYYEVINGMHRYDELKKLKVKKVYCYNHGNISITEAQKRGILTNETRFNSNDAQLIDLIKDLTNEFDLEDLNSTLPFDPHVLLGDDDDIDFSKPSNDNDKTDKIPFEFMDIKSEISMDQYNIINKNIKEGSESSNYEDVIKFIVNKLKIS